MEIKLNEILIRKRNSVLIGKSLKRNSFKKKDVYVATIVKSIESYGYKLSGDILEDLFYMSKEEMISFHKEIIEILKNIVGNKKNMNPLFVNFPESVMKTKESKLYLTQILDAYGIKLQNDVLLKELDKFPLIDEVNYTLLEKGTEKDLIDILVNLLNSKSSLSEYDNQILEELLYEFITEKSFQNRTNDINIVNREVLTKASSIFFDSKGIKANLRRLFTTFAEKQYNSSTDVLRAITMISNGDISLKEDSCYSSFKRADRRIFLGLLEQMKNLEEDMYRHKGKWIRVGEKLHPREYSFFPKVNKTFIKLRENKKIETFNSKVEKLISQKDICSLLDLLTHRPTEFARRLDKMFRIVEQDYLLQAKIISSFNKIIEEIPTIVVLSLITHFSDRDNQKDSRVFFPKGGAAKTYLIPNTLKPLNKNICKNMVLICNNSLHERFSEKESLGNVFIDEDMKEFAVPLVQRNLSKSLKNAGRGSRFKIKEETNFIRPFIYWKDTEDGLEDEYNDYADRNDLDLSILFLDKDLKQIDILTYYRLKSEKLKAYHSGDIQSAPNGASEYADLDIEHLKSEDVKYVVILVNSYTQFDFVDIPEAFVGVMERENNNTGEVYEPTTVRNKSDLITNSTISLANIIDLDKKEILWADISLKQNEFDVNNLSNNESSIIMNTRAMLDKKFVTLYELFEIHGRSRGKIVESIEEADTIFSINKDIVEYDFKDSNNSEIRKKQIITPFMTDKILSEFL